MNTSMSNTTIEFSDRDSLLHANSLLISQLQTRLKMKRWRVQNGENLKVSYVRSLIQAISCQNCLLKDQELDELKKEIEELKEVMKSQSRK